MMMYVDFFYKEYFDVKITSGQGGTLNGIEHCNVRSHCRNVRSHCPMQRRRLSFQGNLRLERHERLCRNNYKISWGGPKRGKLQTTHKAWKRRKENLPATDCGKVFAQLAKGFDSKYSFKVSFEAKNLPQAVAVAVYIFRRCIVLNQFNWRTMIQPTSSVRIHQSSSTQIKILTSDIIEQKDEKCALKGFLVFDELPPRAWHLFEYFWLKITDHQTTFMTETPERQILPKLWVWIKV